MAIDSYASAISSIESGGRYDLLGPVTRDGDRAYGKYQIMGKNVGPWTREVLGREMSPQEFAKDPQAQEAVFSAKFGNYVSKYGPEGAAKAWFAGERGMNNPNARDVLGTSVSDYARKFNAGLGNPQGGAPAPQGGGQNMNPMLLMQNQSIQEEPQQSGLLGGLFNDPGKLAALQLLISGLNPWSKGDELAPFARLAQLRQTQGYERQKDERDYKLREQKFEWEKEQAALSPAIKAARDVLGPDVKSDDPRYKQFMQSYYQLKGDGWKAVNIKNPDGSEQTLFQNGKGEFKRPEEIIPSLAQPQTPATGEGGIRPPPPGVDVKKWRELETTRLVDEGKTKPIPAEQAGRLALAERYLERAGEIRKKISEGYLTGPIDSTMAQTGLGERGQVYADIESGVDALRRGLTGAGMPASEANDYSRRYLPTWKDTVDTLAEKHDRLVDELTRLKTNITQGRGQSKPAAASQSTPSRSDLEAEARRRGLIK